MHLDAGIAHALEKAVGHIPTSHIVVDETHLNTLTCLVDEYIGEQSAQRVVADDVGFKVYVVGGSAKFAQQAVEKVVAAAEDFYLVVFERKSPVVHGEEFDQHVVLLGHHQILLPGKVEHRAFGELVHALLADEPLFAGVLPEKEIEHQSHHGQEDEHQEPCQGLGRLAVVHQHGYGCRDHDADI